MPDQHNNAPSSKLTLRERFGELVGNSPIIGVPVIISIIGYNILRMPDRLARGHLTMKFTSLEKFEPSHEGFGRDPLTPPYWQDLVFGEGRAEKLMARLEGIPQIKNSAQKICLLNSSGGLKILPAHRELIKYGLNDNEIGHLMYDLDRTVMRMARHKDAHNKKGQNITFDDNVSLIMDKSGVYTADENKNAIIEQGDPYQYLRMDLTKLIEAYRATGCKDPEAIHNSNRISQAVYAWVLEDILPVVPNFFMASYGAGFKASPQADGSFRLDRLPEGYELQEHAKGETYFLKKISSENTKSVYEILADGYKGALPPSSIQPTASPSPQ